MNETWIIIDSRTGKRATVASFLSREGAERQIAEWKVRDDAGGRPDCHESMPFLRPAKILPVGWYWFDEKHKCDQQKKYWGDTHRHFEVRPKIVQNNC